MHPLHYQRNLMNYHLNIFKIDKKLIINTAINAQGIDCNDLQHFTTNLQITNTVNDFSF